MRWALFLLLLPFAFAKTFDEIGVHVATNAVEGCKTWLLPYEFDSGCVPYLYIILESGRVTVIDGKNVKTFDEPGRYMVLLRRTGEVNITLCPTVSSPEAKVNGNSALACGDVPLLDISCWVDGFVVNRETEMTCVVRNDGTQDAEAVLSLQLPPFAAFVQPPDKYVHVPAGKSVVKKYRVITSFSGPLADFPPQCVEYSNGRDTVKACTERYPVLPVQGTSVWCVNGEAINTGVSPASIGDSELAPFDSTEMTGETCDFEINGGSAGQKPKEDDRWKIALFLALSALIGLWHRGKK